LPKDSAGKFHMNPQRAARADKMAGGIVAPKKPMSAAKDANGPVDSGEGNSTTLHDNGDGSYKTEGGGESQEHPSIGHALIHIASKHGGDGKHMHIHSDGMGSHTTHHGEGGQVEGPHEHGDTEELKNHVGSVMGDGEGGHASPMSGLY
jgi:hypothetical protein